MAIWRCWSAGRFAPRPHGARRARHLAADRAASGAADAVCDPRPFRRASALAAAHGLWLYDRLASPSGLPGAATVDVTHHPLGNALKRPFGTAFEYSDCVVDDSRLVVANAVDAAERGADIRTGARCVRADRLEIWRLAVIDRGRRRVITARALVNASGAWTASVAETVLRLPPPRAAPMQISQIVVRRLFETDNVYVFQNSDRRLIFASPYERDFTLIGTVGHPFKGDPAAVSMAAADVAYLCDAANRYFRERVEPSDVVRTVSGANMAVDPASRRAARDGAMTFDARRRQAPLLTIFGGDVTTSRLRAERAVSKLTPFYPMSPRWTAKAPLPGGDFAWARFDAEVDRARERWRFLGEDRGAAPGRCLWLPPCGRARRRQEPRRSRPGVRAGTDGRGGALSHGKGMGAVSRRHSLAPLQARPDHDAGGSRGAGGVMARPM